MVTLVWSWRQNPRNATAAPDDACIFSAFWFLHGSVFSHVTACHVTFETWCWPCANYDRSLHRDDTAHVNHSSTSAAAARSDLCLDIHRPNCISGQRGPVWHVTVTAMTQLNLVLIISATSRSQRCLSASWKGLPSSQQFGQNARS